jgi:hypothetical protein
MATATTPNHDEMDGPGGLGGPAPVTRAPQYRAELGWTTGSRTRVVVVPDLMGSRLVDARDGLTLWGDAGMSQWLLDLDEWLRRMSSGNGMDDPGRVRPAGHVQLGWPYDASDSDPYERYVARLRKDEGAPDVLLFSYDWRLQLEHSAKRLLQFLERRWTDASTDASQRGTMVGHGMGGLVARYCIENLGGWRYIDRMLVFGTPHRGAVRTQYMHSVLDDGGAWLKDLGAPDLLVSGKLNLLQRMISLLGRYASFNQMLPTYPFFFPTRASKVPEAMAKTMRRLRHDPALNRLFGKPGAGEVLVRSEHFPKLRKLMLTLRRNETKLRRFLVDKDVHYFAAAGTGMKTTVGLRYEGDGKVVDVAARRGDEVVPDFSATLPDYERIAAIVFRGQPNHRSIIRDPEAARLTMSVVTAGDVAPDEDWVKEQRQRRMKARTAAKARQKSA